jgi:tetratricopeptide (TPR) repeat protein
MQSTLLTIFLMAIFQTPIAAIQESDIPTPSQHPNYLLAEEFVRVARLASMSEPLDINAIQAALTLATEATRLTPEDPSVWRVLNEVAQMADLQTLSKDARENLLRFAPHQTTNQLARLRDAINNAQTLDERMSLYEQLLSESRLKQLDPRVAARLALDAAYLQRQVGDITQFARWLAEAVALDPSYPDAMSLATGFFGDESADIYRRAELLSAAMLSNIRDMTTQIALAEFLMSFGDYEDAKQIYEIILGDNISTPSLISDNLLADIVLSQWAAGDGELAMDVLMKRQTASDERFRRQTQVQNPELSPLELARIHAPLVPKLSVVRAVLFADEAETIQAAMALESVSASLLTLAQIYEAQGELAVIRVVELYVQMAWIVLWLDDDVESARILIQHAETGATLDPAEKQRFEGWIAFRLGDIQTAKSILLPLHDDPAAKAGLGLVYLEEGNKKAAALEFLSVAKNHGGTLLGVWAKNKLQEIVGTTFDIRPEVPQLQELMSGVIQTLNSFVNDPRPPIDIQLVPETQTYAPYQPILLTLILTNNTTLPLTIASNGPIQPLAFVEANIEIPGSPRTPSPPIIVSIDRELSIKPRGKLYVTIDLRKHWIGGLLDTHPLRGASIALKAIVNFTARETTTRSGDKILVYEPGALGKKTIPNPVRVNGIRLTDVWLKGAIEEASNVMDTGNLIKLVLLTHVIGDDVSVAIEEPLITPPPGQEPFVPESGERHPLQDEAITTILTSFPKLDSVSQSWVLSTMSDDPTIEAVTGMLKEPDSTTPQLAWLIRYASPYVKDEALDDVRLLDALQSENKEVQKVATWVYGFVQKVVNQRAEQLLGGT